MAFTFPFILYIVIVFLFKSSIFALGYVNYNRSHKGTLKLASLKIKPNSFILGNSRSLSIKASDWENYLDDKSIPFHFDGSRENIYQTRKKIEYLIRNGFHIKNLIIVADFESLNEYDNNGHIYQLSPKVSGSFLLFHLNEIKAFFNIKFIFSLLYYSVTKNYYKFMRGFILKESNFIEENLNDLKFVDEDLIKTDSLAYYSSPDIRRMFREKKYTRLIYPDRLLSELQKIKSLTVKESIDLKIVLISPYNVKELGDDYLSILKKIFTSEEIFNFTNDKYKFKKGNFYESSHFRPHIGRKILKKIYEQGNN